MDAQLMQQYTTDTLLLLAWQHGLRQNTLELDRSHAAHMVPACGVALCKCADGLCVPY